MVRPGAKRPAGVHDERELWDTEMPLAAVYEIDRQGAEMLDSGPMPGMLYAVDFYVVRGIRSFFLHVGDFFFASFGENLDKDARFFPPHQFQLPYPP